jgi:hypothetical protein
MIFKPLRSAATDQPKPSQAIATITDEARALRPPTPSLYYACMQERLHAQAAELSALNTAMERARTEGFAAAVRLMSLDAPERIVFNAFTEVSGGQGGTP